MSQRGLSSRREAESYISRGLVYVNGHKINEPGTKLLPTDIITIKRPQNEAPKITVLVNKPIGYVSSQPEKNYKSAVSLITPENRSASHYSKRKFRRSHLRGLAPAGRLDINSTGLLVFTQDGLIAKHLIGNNTQTEKEYVVRILGSLTDSKIRKLSEGMSLDDTRLKPAKVTRTKKDQLNFILQEGKKRRIRRMCEKLDLQVITLHRIRIGKILLGPLKLGTWRYLNNSEEF